MRYLSAIATPPGQSMTPRWNEPLQDENIVPGANGPEPCLRWPPGQNDAAAARADGVLIRRGYRTNAAFASRRDIHELSTIGLRWGRDSYPAPTPARACGRKTPAPRERGSRGRRAACASAR